MTDKNNIPRVKVFQQLKINVSNVMYVYKKRQRYGEQHMEETNQWNNKAMLKNTMNAKRKN